MNWKIGGIIYAILWALSVHVGFAGGFSGSVLLGYLLITVLYLFPVVFLLRTNVSDNVLVVTLIATTLVPAILVIDPLESGLFGHDPYMFTLPSLQLFKEGDIAGMFDEFSWPGMYSLFMIIEVTLDANTMRLGKYLPLISLSIPVFGFLAVRRFVCQWDAFAISTVLASVRNLFFMDMKFVDEFPAAVLFFAILVLFNREKEQRSLILSVILLATVIITHHAVALFLLLFLTLTKLVPILLSASFFPERLKPIDIGIDRLGSVIICGWIGLISLILLSGSSYTQKLLGTIVAAVTRGRTLGSSGGINQEITIITEFLSRLAIIPIGLLCLLVAVGVLRKKRLSSWRIGWSGYAFIIGTIYVLSLAVGRLVPLNSGRVLLFWMPALLILGVLSVRESLPGTKATITVFILLSMLIFTQLAAVNPNMLYTDVSETTLDEGHYTSSQFAGSEWVSEYKGGVVEGRERGLWNSHGNKYIDPRYWSDQSCNLRAWRPSYPDQLSAQRSVVYNSGKVLLSTC